MAHIRLTDFRGLAPIHPDTELPPGFASVAQDVLFEAGNLRKLWGTTDEGTSPTNIGKLFKYRPWGQGSYWLAWPDTADYDVVPSPIQADTLGRIYWTRKRRGPTDTGDEFPRAASQPTTASIAADNLLSSPVRRLGLPPPSKAPETLEIRPLARAGIAAISKTAPITLTFSQDHPFKDGQRIVVRIFPDGVPEENQGNMVELDGKEFVVKPISATEVELRGSNGTQYSDFDLSRTPNAYAERVFASGDLVSRSYVYTYVSDWGEESAPSPPSVVADFVRESAADLTIKIDPMGNYRRPNRVRIYRAMSGQQGVGFFFVREHSFSSEVGTVVVRDDVDTAAVGELLPSEEWTPPPEGLTGLRQMPNGFLVGFIGNTLYFSEPYMPHAWPDRYRRTVREEIVGIEVYGQTLVIGTRGKPYVAIGTDPASVSLQELDVNAPCLSKGSMVSIGSGVAYASTEGLALASGQGVSVVTRAIMSRENWIALWTSAAARVAAFWNRHYLAFGIGGWTSFSIGLDGDNANVALFNRGARAAAVDPDDDRLAFVPWETPSQFVKFAVGFPQSQLPIRWRSGIFTLTRPTNLSCAQVFATSYPVTMVVHYSDAVQGSLSVPAGSAQEPGAQTFNNAWKAFPVWVYGAEPFRLPADALSREWAVELVSDSGKIREVVLAEYIEELGLV